MLAIARSAGNNAHSLSKFQSSLHGDRERYHARHWEFWDLLSWSVERTEVNAPRPCNVSMSPCNAFCTTHAYMTQTRHKESRKHRFATCAPALWHAAPTRGCTLHAFNFRRPMRIPKKSRKRRIITHNVGVLSLMATDPRGQVVFLVVSI